MDARIARPTPRSHPGAMVDSEVIRALGVFGSLFRRAPLVARDCARAADRAAGRALILKHMAQLRHKAGVGLRISGEEHVPAEGAFVLVYNQTSLADDLGNLDVLWRHVDLSTLAAEYGLIPFFPRAAERVGLVLVQRGNRSATDGVLRRLSKAVRAGGRISMAAEGRLSPDGEVGHFKRGAISRGDSRRRARDPDVCAWRTRNPCSRLAADACGDATLPNRTAHRYSRVR